MEKLIKVCFREFCSIAGDSPCGCDGCPYGAYDTENGECYEEYKKHKLKELEQAGVTVQKWIPVSERLPDSGVHVLICCGIRSGGTVYKRYICDGYYAKRYTEQTWNNRGDIACEYREEDDEYYLLEGWYEVIKNWDDYNSIVIGDFVTHWMPLPALPQEE